MDGGWSYAGAQDWKQQREPGDLRWPTRQVTIAIICYLAAVWAFLLFAVQSVLH